MKAIDIKNVLKAMTEAFPPPAGQRHNLTLGQDGRLCMTLMLGRMFPMAMSDDHEFDDINISIEEARTLINKFSEIERQLQMLRGAIERELGREAMTHEELEVRCGVKPEHRRHFVLALAEVMKRPDFKFLDTHPSGRMMINPPTTQP